VHARRRWDSGRAAAACAAPAIACHTVKQSGGGHPAEGSEATAWGAVRVCARMSGERKRLEGRACVEEHGIAAPLTSTSHMAC
jgi:hypothetical protein